LSTNVFANGLEVSGKATPNKSICAMPDVCMSPPSPPAGPIPIPYPNTATASDTDSGTRRVKIGNKEVGKKNASNYKTSDGNQPATNSFGAGIISHKLTGSLQFAAYSFTVKFEDSGAERFMDLTTQNHSNPTNGPMTTSMASADAAMDDEKPCEKLGKANDQAREELKGSGRESLKRVGEGNTTITHGIYEPPGGPKQVVRACSRKIVTGYDNSFAEGLTSDDKGIRRVGDSSQVSSRLNDNETCGDHTYKEGFFRPHTSHTEARIIEDIMKKAMPSNGHMGSITLSIDWPGGEESGASRRSPCHNCRTLLCAAKKCFNIMLCSEEDEPRELKCP
jgi:Domain of unknown function (DUF4150)